MVFVFNLFVIVELGIVIGFDFELIDQVGFGYEKLIQVCNQLFVEVVKYFDMLISVCLNGLEDILQFKIDIDQEKVQVLGVFINDINIILGVVWGGSYVNDFIDCGCVKKVYVMLEVKYCMLLDDIGDWYVCVVDGQMVLFLVFFFLLGVWFVVFGML